MTNLLKALTWRIRGSYDPEEGVTENSPVRARNRAKWGAWKYHTFGPGRDVFCRDKDFVYQIIDSGELQGEPLHLHNPSEIAGLASIIAEMEGHKFIAMMTPVGTFKTKEDVRKEEDTAIDRIVQYLIPDDLPVRQYVVLHEDKSRINRWTGLPVLIPEIRGIEPDVPRYRENYRRMFREMLEKLKERNSPGYEKPSF